MRNVKILFIEDAKKDLLYPIKKLKKDESGYYKFCNADPSIRKNFSKYVDMSSKEYCFIITLENKILEYIYKDKIYTLNPVVENLYCFSEDIEINNNKNFVKKINRFEK